MLHVVGGLVEAALVYAEEELLAVLGGFCGEEGDLEQVVADFPLFEAVDFVDDAYDGSFRVG